MRAGSLHQASTTPSGATAAQTLAEKGHSVLLLDRAGRVKPCGGAIPPRLIRDYDIPDELLVARARSARMVAPSGKHVDIPIDNGFVGMVDREHFDEWLRQRAVRRGALRRDGVELVRTLQRQTADVVFLDVNRPVNENLKLIADSEHSRFPVCRGSLREVLGIPSLELRVPRQDVRKSPRVGRAS